MIPNLYSKDETSFNSNGICKLVDILDDPVVTEERNGIYECEFRYPVDGRHFSDIKEGCVIYCYHDDSKRSQPFDIYAHSAPLDGIVTFYAHHISYRLGKITLKPFTAGSCAETFTKIVPNSINANPFTFWTDKDVTSPFEIKTPVNAKAILGGIEGSILDVYGKGEYEYDHFNVKLHLNRGNDNGVSIRYGKNLTKLTHDYDSSETYNAVAPYWMSEDTVVTLPEWYITRSDIGPNETIELVPMDLSDKFDEEPSVAELRNKAQNLLDGSQSWVAKESVDVDFESLWQSEEFETYASLQRVFLCDKVDVINPEMDLIKIKMEVIRTSYNFVTEKYTSLTLGTAHTSFSEALMASTEELIADLPTKSFMQAAIDYATNLIQGGLGGHVIFNTNAAGQPEEILVMDTDNVQTAVNVWRFNLGGLGHSHNGYNGPFSDIALTMDGRINANMITTGILNADVIRAGIITDQTGTSWWNLDTGEVHINIGPADIGAVSTDELNTAMSSSEIGLSLAESKMPIDKSNIAINYDSDGWISFNAHVIDLESDYELETLWGSNYFDSTRYPEGKYHLEFLRKDFSSNLATADRRYDCLVIRYVDRDDNTEYNHIFSFANDDTDYQKWDIDAKSIKYIYMRYGDFADANISGKFKISIQRWTDAETDLESKYTTLDVTVDGINTEVGKKVGKTEVISSINQSAESVAINANKISLNGKTIALTGDNINISSTNFNVDNNGNMTCNDATIAGSQMRFGPNSQATLRSTRSAKFSQKDHTNEDYSIITSGVSVPLVELIGNTVIGLTSDYGAVYLQGFYYRLLVDDYGFHFQHRPVNGSWSDFYFIDINNHPASGSGGGGDIIIL